MPRAAALTITSGALSFLTRPISTAEQTARTTKLLAHTELMKRLILMNSGWSHSVLGALRFAIASVNGCPTTSEVTAMAPSVPADRAASQRCTEECGETSAIALMAPKNASVPIDSTSSWFLRLSDTASSAWTISAANTPARQSASDETTPKVIQGRKPRTYSTMRRRLWKTSQQGVPRCGTLGAVWTIYLPRQA